LPFHGNHSGCFFDDTQFRAKIEIYDLSEQGSRRQWEAKELMSVDVL
jgi:hypothetical protein